MESLAEILGRLLARVLRLEGPVVALLARTLAIAGAVLLAVIAYRLIGEAAGRRWAQETGQALEAPEAQGIVRFGDAEVVLRLQVKVRPAERFAIENDLRRRILEEFRAAGIREPRKTLYVVQERPGGVL